ncbi:cleavage polyadenylation factor subunit CFT2 [Aspergillus lucknowensis]|uniref:Cleavage and polyadenylation specificity factor subunit 2 n=1 Tax=Aspergillus lucknowensis TaxID=176173 RepID=A0ABR4LGD3_9EURO
MFTFTPLLGAQSSASKASQSILELDGGVKILVDVGWDDTFDPLDLVELEKHVPTLSLILLTHATPSHIGAYVHCCKTFPLFTQIPIYATSPVIALGRTLLQELYSSAPLAATFLPKASISELGASISAASTASVAEGDGSVEVTSAGRILLQPPTAEEIARYFSLIQPLKYSQPHQPIPSPFSPPLNGLTLTAYNAGHTVGGTIWHIQHGMESIVYAVDWNQARESVVAGAAWFGGSGASGTEVIEQLRKPTALICSTRGGDKFALSGGRKKRDELLLDMIRSTLVKGGTILIPTDTSARVLELAYALEHAWRDAARDTKDDVLKRGGLYLAGRKANTTMRLARSMLEWMDENIVREFEAAEAADGTSQSHGTADPRQPKADGKGLGPFTFKHLRIVERKTKLEKLLSDGTPKVILASDSSLDWGFAKESLRALAGGRDNLLLLTEPLHYRKVSYKTDEAHRRTLGSMIWQWYEERQDGVALEKGSDGEMLEQVHSGGRELSWMDVQRAPLEYGEQLLYQQYLATKRQFQDTAQTRGQENLDTTADAIDDRSSSLSEDSETEQQGRVLNFSTSLAHANRNKLGLTDEDLGVNVLLRRKNVFDYDVRGKKGRERMFPYVAPRKKGDEYGELIRPEEYLRAEEREEIDMQQRRTESQLKLGQKRRWDDAGPSGRQNTGGPNRRRRDGDDAERKDADLLDNLSLTEGGDGADEAATSGTELDEQAFEGPAKAIYEKATLTINARLAFVDFTGIHDKRSLEMLIPLIQPRTLILVGGMKEETMALATECQKLLVAKSGVDASSATAAVIFTPVNKEVVDASVDTSAWMVKLSNNLVRRLRWQHVRSLGVVTVTGQLKGPELTSTDEEPTDSPSKKQKLTNETASENATPTTAESKQAIDTPESHPILDIPPANMASGTRSMTRPLHVGDLRLADLRKIMQGAGHTAEFRGEGTLLIDGMVAVRKSGTGRIEIEAAAYSAAPNMGFGQGAGSFLAVKRKIYEGLAVVAGS